MAGKLLKWLTPDIMAWGEWRKWEGFPFGEDSRQSWLSQAIGLYINTIIDVNFPSYSNWNRNKYLFLKASITAAADYKFCDIFTNLRKKKRYDISWESSASKRTYEIPWLICYFWKKKQNLKLSSAANYRWRIMGQDVIIIWASMRQNLSLGFPTKSFSKTARSATDTS